MKKLLLALLIVALACVPAFAAGPTIEEAGYMQFTAAAQTTDEQFIIYSICWVSSSGSEITAADGFELQNGAGVTIWAAEATTVADHLTVTMPHGLKVKGLTATALDNGYLYIYGKRR